MKFRGMNVSQDYIDGFNNPFDLPFSEDFEDGQNHKQELLYEEELRKRGELCEKSFWSRKN